REHRRCRLDRDCQAGRVHQRPNHERPKEADRLPRNLHALHAGEPAGGEHGLGGGRLRLLLRIRPAPRGGGAVKEAILRKARESAAVKEAFFRVEAERIEVLACAMATAFERGGRLYVMGNGGGATDAQHVAVEFGHPILEKRRPLPALALTTDTALLTAISNDRDFAKVFGDQL